MKCYVCASTGETIPVAPHWGAWIEIRVETRRSRPTRSSHPTGVRGLKYNQLTMNTGWDTSHPTGVRGLK